MDDLGVAEGLFSKRRLEKVLLVSQIISMLAIPLVLAVIGYWVQQGLQDQQVKRDYVNLAISILSPKKEGEPKITPELSSWAIRLLNESSPVKLSESEISSISNNGLAVGNEFSRYMNSAKNYENSREMLRREVEAIEAFSDIVNGGEALERRSRSK